MTPGSGNKLMSAAGVRGFAFSSDGGLLAGTDGVTTKIWDLSTGSQKQAVQRSLADSFFMSDIALSRDGHELITLSRQTSGVQVVRNAPAQMKSNTTVHFTSVETGQETSAVVIAGEIPQAMMGRRLAVTPDGRVLLLTVSNSSVNIWDVSSKTQSRILSYKVQEGLGAFKEAQFLSADGRLAVFAHGNHISVWDVEHQSELYGVDVEKSAVYDIGMPSSIVLNADSKWLAIGNYDGTIRILDAFSGRLFSRLAGSVNPARSLSFSANGGLLYSGAKTKWNLGSGRGESMMVGASGNTGLVSPSGTLVAEPSQSAAEVRVWDVEHQTSMPTFALASESLPSLMAFSPDEKLLAVTYRQSAAQIEKQNSNAQASTIPRPTIDKKKLQEAIKKDKKNGMAAAMAEYNRQVAEAQGSAQTPQVEQAYTQTKIWDIRSGQQLQSLTTAPAYSYGTTESIAFSPDGKFLATAQSGVLKIWNVHTGRKSAASARVILAQQLWRGRLPTRPWVLWVTVPTENIWRSRKKLRPLTRKNSWQKCKTRCGMAICRAASLFPKEASLVDCSPKSGPLHPVRPTRKQWRPFGQPFLRPPTWHIRFPVPSKSGMSLLDRGSFPYPATQTAQPLSHSVRTAHVWPLVVRTMTSNYGILRTAKKSVRFWVIQR